MEVWRRAIALIPLDLTFIARTYALTETTNYGLPLVTRLCLVMLLLWAAASRQTVRQ